MRTLHPTKLFDSVSSPSPLEIDSSASLSAQNWCALPIVPQPPAPGNKRSGKTVHVTPAPGDAYFAIEHSTSIRQNRHAEQSRSRKCTRCRYVFCTRIDFCLPKKVVVVWGVSKTYNARKSPPLAGVTLEKKRTNSDPPTQQTSISPESFCSHPEVVLETHFFPFETCTPSLLSANAFA